jgi:hypothetical protein
MLMIEAGTKNGEMRRGPRSRYSLCVSSISGRPPMPEPTMTPMRSRLRGQGLARGQARITHGLHAMQPAVMDEGVHVAGFLTGDVVLDVEALDLTGKLAGQQPLASNLVMV